MAFVTDLGFTLLELGAAKDAGDVRSQVHPEFPRLEIFNYTEEVQYRNKWNNITLMCRGLILDTVTGEVVARPWEKFFNLGQTDSQIDPTAPVEVTDKMDGSLGILYRRPDGKFAIATRGSFASEQALHATELLNTKYAHLFDYESGIAGKDFFGEYLRGQTFLFEIIYPENRIVVNYDGMDDLVLLGAVDKQHGFYSGPRTAAAALVWDGPVAEVFEAENFVAALSLPDRKGKEGYVIRSGRNIVKLKQQDYVELHRIVTNLSPKTIWEMLSRGKTVGDICLDIPDEFHKYVEDIGNELLERASEIKFGALIDYNEVVMETGTTDRRAFALKAKTKRNPALLFSMLDRKPVTEQIWKMVKPRGDVKSLVEDRE